MNGHRAKQLWALRPLVSIIVLCVLAVMYDLHAVWHTLTDLNARVVAGAVVLFAMCIGVSIAKWRLPVPQISVRVATRAYLESIAISLLPTGQLGGEASKVTVAASQRLPVSTLAASVVYDKVTSLVALTSIGLVTAATSGAAIASPVAWLLAATLLGLLAVLWLSPVAARLRGGGGHLGRAWLGLRNMFNAIAGYSRRPTLLAISLSMGLCTQALMLGVYLLMARGLDVDVAANDLIWIVVVANLAAVVPVSLAGLGIRELGLIALLGRYSVSPETAFALSLSCFGIFLTGALAGLISQLLPASSPANDSSAIR